MITQIIGKQNKDLVEKNILESPTEYLGDTWLTRMVRATP